MNKTENKKKEDILKKAKKIVSVEGWSSEIFLKLQKQNIEKNDLFYFYPNGYKDLLEYALQNINEKLELKLKKINLINFPINKRIKKINPSCKILIDLPGIKPRTLNQHKLQIKKNEKIIFYFKKIVIV